MLGDQSQADPYPASASKFPSTISGESIQFHRSEVGVGMVDNSVKIVLASLKFLKRRSAKRKDTINFF